MSGKRTRPIRGKYFLTVPRVAIEGRIYEIKLKISQVIVKEVGKTRIRSHHAAGEIERGRVDGDED